MAVYLWIQRRYPGTRHLGLFATAAALALLLYGAAHPHAPAPLAEEYRSGWFAVHVLAAFAAYGCYVTSTAAAAALLLPPRRRERLPGPDRLEDLAFRLAAHGFVFHAAMLASGAVWAANAWGRYWSWDPVETWSLATWLLYAFFLHARAFLGWHGRRLAAVSLAAFASIVYTFWGVPHIPVHPGRPGP
nr:cytochrome c biogenesis protein CcsA [Dissulfurirhabdus thermomarina]